MHVGPGRRLGEHPWVRGRSPLQPLLPSVRNPGHGCALPRPSWPCPQKSHLAWAECAGRCLGVAPAEHSPMHLQLGNVEWPRLHALAIIRNAVGH